MSTHAAAAVMNSSSPSLFSFLNLLFPLQGHREVCSLSQHALHGRKEGKKKNIPKHPWQVDRLSRGQQPGKLILTLRSFRECGLPGLHDSGLVEENGTHREAQAKKQQPKKQWDFYDRGKKWLEEKVMIGAITIMLSASSLNLICLPLTLFVPLFAAPHLLPQRFPPHKPWLTLPSHWTPDLWQHLSSRSIHNYLQFNYPFTHCG